MKTKSSNYQMPVFIIGMILFSVVACLGWIKLQYGFNFIDEGYHATESWRLAAGDHFLEDKITGALMHYTLISRIVFKIYPDISLLEWRQLQFILVIFSLLLFSFALFRYSGRYAWLPIVFSLFAFTGFDPIGMISNLYYQTYPHFFLVLYLSFMLFGFQTKNFTIKKIFFLLSGLCLWLMSLSLLYLGTVVLTPLLLFIFARKAGFNHFSFSFQDLLYVTSPFVICWLLFIATFNQAYLANLYESLSVISSMSTYSGGLITINWELLKYVSASGVFLLMFFSAISYLPLQFFMPICAILSVTIFFIINTSFFGFLQPYYNGWFGKPMWFSSLLMAFTLLFWLNIFKKIFLKETIGEIQTLAIILMMPFTLCAVTMSVFSGLGSLSVCQSAIPAVAALAYMLASQLKTIKYRQPVAIVILIMLLGPFYYTTARHDWDFTFFDVRPKQDKVRIKAGFGRGIYTNQLYSRLYNWLAANAAAFTQPDDYAISYVVSPMVHMITRLRPSLDGTFITFDKPQNYYEKCIKKMEKRGREPKIAFIFERRLMLLPVSHKLDSVIFPGKEFNFPSSQDPISVYIRTHMTPAATFKISNDHVIRCYVNHNLPKK